MNQVTVFMTCVGAGLLAACASDPVQDQYYSLVLAADDVPVRTMTNMAGARLIIGPVRMARYLNQAGFATQKGEQQIQIANHSFWAEPLDEGIGKVLVRDIAMGDASLTVTRDAGRWLGKGDCRLRLEFDKFQVTDAATVVARGRYWLSSELEGHDVQSEFDLSQSLNVDGYANAVNQLRALLGELSGEIIAVISENKMCDVALSVPHKDAGAISAVIAGGAVLENEL
jgi:uncharacterized lipoprotein YmbA